MNGYRDVFRVDCSKCSIHLLGGGVAEDGVREQ